MRHRFNRPNLCLARDMFVFSTFTGLCHADLTRLSDEHIVQAADGSLWIEIKRQRPARIPVSACWKSRCKLWRNTARRKKDKHIFYVYGRGYMANCYARSPGYAVRATSPFTRPGIISERISRSLRVFPSKPLAG